MFRYCQLICAPILNNQSAIYMYMYISCNFASNNRHVSFSHYFITTCIQLAAYMFTTARRFVQSRLNYKYGIFALAHLRNEVKFLPKNKSHLQSFVCRSCIWHKIFYSSLDDFWQIFPRQRTPPSCDWFDISSRAVLIYFKGVQKAHV